MKFFPQQVDLAEKDIKAMEKTIQLLFRLKSRDDYKQKLFQKNTRLFPPGLRQDSVLMAYDFHITAQGPRLIEVNTNGAGFLLLDALYRLRGDTLKAESAKQDLKAAFQKEWDKFRKGRRLPSVPKNVVLIDEDPSHQILAVEFLMYRDFFASMGWPPCEILDSKSLKRDEKGGLQSPSGRPVDFVYNRLTDFYFEKHPHLLYAFKQGLCAFSPHPLEYFLLADKNRLCDWAKQKEQYEELRELGEIIPHSELLRAGNRDRLWVERKRYFFKASRGFGSRRAYRGKSLSRRKFEELLEDESLAQEFVPPSVVKDYNGKEWKTDFRAYVYEDRIQQLGARAYRGRLTNFKEEGGGWACVRTVS